MTQGAQEELYAERVSICEHDISGNKNMILRYMVMSGTWMAGNMPRRRVTVSLYIYLYLLDVKSYEYNTHLHKKLNVIFNNKILKGC